MTDTRVIPIFCGMWGPSAGCGIYAHVKDGRFIRYRFLMAHGSPNYCHSGICAMQNAFSCAYTLGAPFFRWPIIRTAISGQMEEGCKRLERFLSGGHEQRALRFGTLDELSERTTRRSARKMAEKGNPPD